jgi:hypothetical protein
LRSPKDKFRGSGFGNSEGEGLDFVRGKNKSLELKIKKIKLGEKLGY